MFVNEATWCWSEHTCQWLTLATSQDWLKVLHTYTSHVLTDHNSNGSCNINFCLVTFCLVWILVQLQTDRQADRKRCICTGLLKNGIQVLDRIFRTFIFLPWISLRLFIHFWDRRRGFLTLVRQLLINITVVTLCHVQCGCTWIIPAILHVRKLAWPLTCSKIIKW